MILWNLIELQIRCKNSNLCSKEGTTVTVTDQNTNNQTDFVVSSRTFSAMANQGKAQDILKLGIVDVEYKRSVGYLHLLCALLAYYLPCTLSISIYANIFCFLKINSTNLPG